MKINIICMKSRLTKHDFNNKNIDIFLNNDIYKYILYMTLETISE